MGSNNKMSKIAELIKVLRQCEKTGVSGGDGYTAMVVQLRELLKGVDTAKLYDSSGVLDLTDMEWLMRNFYH